jgi:8-oxo-dGTP diphosphatase
VVVRHVVDVLVALLRDEQVLLTQRKGGPWDGMWHLPSGKLDAGEAATAAAAREAEEEIGVVIDPAHLTCAHTIHVSGSGPEPRLGFFFTTRRWRGEPGNREPDKCAGLRWFPMNAPPLNIISYPAHGLRGIREDTLYSELGWHAARTAR